MEACMIRLDKYLADMGIGTRSEVKRLIRQGQVAVDDTVCRSPEQKVEPGKQEVKLDGQPLAYQKFYYYMFHKPAGVVTAREDARDKTVMEVLREQGLSCPAFAELSPAGRLDKDTEGLLLITNDGMLAHNLLAPGRHVEKEYECLLARSFGDEQKTLLEQGVDIGEKRLTAPAFVRILEDRKIRLTITEGKFHQVKRMLHAVGNEVVSLKRVRMGNLVLDEQLPKGSYRRLTQEEVRRLKIVGGRL